MFLDIQCGTLLEHLHGELLSPENTNSSAKTYDNKICSDGLKNYL